MSPGHAMYDGPELANGQHSTHNANARLDQESFAVAEKYGDASSVKPMLSEFVKNSDLFRLLYEVLEHHVSLVKTRSQALEDGQITIYDKALLKLSEKGAGTCYMGAIQLFLEEIMGIKGVETADLEALVVKHVAVKSLLVNATRTNNEQAIARIPALPETKAIPNGKAQAQTHEDKDENGPLSNATELKTIKDSLSRILTTFSNAQREYKLISESDVVAKSRAAKFLRDTAENALNYLHARNMEHDMVPTLEAAFQMAKEKAITLSGGRKRPFEIHEVDCSRVGKTAASSAASSRYGRRSSQTRSRCARASRRRGDCYRPY
ncbi:conserved hypothetical protein [Histoplasma capsulatum G186AR]|uniref:Uncharacterized protein n=2 Tax=Ajellomyces capsulatus TaxID=5037 RepID=C0NPE7_AJECG|nr:uncharacterized protein HCBG_05027 [Histoplasma capsulatum G186AR]EEH06807.1 conserved hypothetical protein [Histoplasma capsulatum G186AR]KAG5286913.1 hypothetical protein I7I52_12703 [Histoplasma capsulatum]QSS75619.1 hypothetical protein I7I50_04806 [Histoplasma capsulatum G186AR]